ncbi:hypothetical protein [Streptomyces orinoci]|uniref:Lipoprotein n=1 Tax=Streptomyces orinoci TaxID=67339 RepID=A0ABV3K5L6_STRON|nr:hypothetical protein [Streptomyces orinoci]
MTGKSLRSVCALAAAAFALTSVTACGGDKSDKSDKGASSASPADQGKSPVAQAISALRKAATATDGAHSAKVEGTTTMAATGTMNMNGALDWADGVQGDVTISGGQGAMGALMKGPGGMHARYLKDAYYVNIGEASPQMAAQLGGKHWIKYDYDWMAKKLGPSGAYLKDQMQNNNPTRSVQMLIGSGDVRQVGTETVRNVKATHYSGTIDVSRMAEKQSSLGKDQLDQLKRQLQQSGATTEQVDVWVSDDNLLVKKVEKANGGSGTTESTVYYSDYGTKVSAGAPDASDTVDAATLPGMS